MFYELTDIILQKTPEGLSNGKTKTSLSLVLLILASPPQCWRFYFLFTHQNDFGRKSSPTLFCCLLLYLILQVITNFPWSWEVSSLLSNFTSKMPILPIWFVLVALFIIISNFRQKEILISIYKFFARKIRLWKRLCQNFEYWQFLGVDIKWGNPFWNMGDHNSPRFLRFCSKTFCIVNLTLLMFKMAPLSR